MPLTDQWCSLELATDITIPVFKDVSEKLVAWQITITGYPFF